jgi:hypothetical protein
MPKTVKWNANLSMIVEDVCRPTLPSFPDSRVAPYHEGASSQPPRMSLRP